MTDQRVQDVSERTHDPGSAREPGIPRVWNPHWLLQPADPAVELPRYAGEGVFGPSIYGFPVRWR
jgi:hypothetical protein